MKSGKKMKKALLALLFLLCIFFISSCKNEFMYEEYYYQFYICNLNSYDSFIIKSQDELNNYIDSKNTSLKKPSPVHVKDKKMEYLDNLPINFDKEKLLVIEYALGYDVSQRYINSFKYENEEFSIMLYEDGDIYMDLESTIAYCIKVDKEVSIKSLSCKIIEKRSNSEKIYYDFNKTF